MPELRNRADVIGGPTGFASQVLELCNVFIQRISLHFHLQEFLVSSQLFLAVGKRAPKIPFKDCPQDFRLGWDGWLTGCAMGESFDFMNHPCPSILNILPFDVGEDQGNSF